MACLNKCVCACLCGFLLDFFLFFWKCCLLSSCDASLLFLDCLEVFSFGQSHLGRVLWTIVVVIVVDESEWQCTSCDQLWSVVECWRIKWVGEGSRSRTQSEQLWLSSGNFWLVFRFGCSTQWGFVECTKVFGLGLGYFGGIADAGKGSFWQIGCGCSESIYWIGGVFDLNHQMRQ